METPDNMKHVPTLTRSVDVQGILHMCEDEDDYQDWDIESLRAEVERKKMTYEKLREAMSGIFTVLKNNIKSVDNLEDELKKLKKELKESEMEEETRNDKYGSLDITKRLQYSENDIKAIYKNGFNTMSEEFPGLLEDMDKMLGELIDVTEKINTSKENYNATQKQVKEKLSSLL